MTRTMPITTKTSDKPVTDNYDRLLAILERNAASVQHEPELARRLREAAERVQAARRGCP
jgi:hypothetical protein